MKIALIYPNSPKIHRYPACKGNKCNGCGTLFSELYREKERAVRTLTGIVIQVDHIWGCQNLECPQAYQQQYPLRCTPPKSSFHLEVIAEVGRLRKEEHKTFQQITDSLRKQQVLLGRFGSASYHLYGYYEIYELLWNEERLNDHCQGQDVVISIDGMKPEKGGETLYSVTDTGSGLQYSDEWELYSDTATITATYHHVAALPIHVVGIVSDKQKTLLLGAQQVFPSVPHQLCQWHFLHDASEPLNAADQSLVKELKKPLRPLRQLTIDTKKAVDAGTLPPSNLQCLQEIEPYLTVILKAKSKPPFIFKSLLMWQYLKTLLACLLALVEASTNFRLEATAGNVPPMCKTLQKVIQILSDDCELHVFTCHSLTCGLQWLVKVWELLDPATTPSDWFTSDDLRSLAYTRLETFVHTLDSSQTPVLDQFRMFLQRTLQKWSLALFTCFNAPYIPRTNVTKEQWFNHVKQHQAKISGRANNHQTLQRHPTATTPSLAEELAKFSDFCLHVTLQQYYSIRTKYLHRLVPIKRRLSIKRNFSRHWNTSFSKLQEVYAMS